VSPTHARHHVADGKDELFGTTLACSPDNLQSTTFGNAHAEQFVRSIKESCLERMIFFGEDALRKAVHDFVAHYHFERNHQGLGNRLIVPLTTSVETVGTVQRRQRLGGLLNYYHRQAA